LLQSIVAIAATSSFTYSSRWLRTLMAPLTAPRFAPALRKLTPPPNMPSSGGQPSPPRGSSPS